MEIKNKGLTITSISFLVVDLVLLIAITSVILKFGSLFKMYATEHLSTGVNPANTIALMVILLLKELLENKKFTLGVNIAVLIMYFVVIFPSLSTALFLPIEAITQVK
ncbi:hypothetical protein ACFL38_00965 [Candidatus Omnitrophota bacterium]